MQPPQWFSLVERTFPPIRALGWRPSLQASKEAPFSETVHPRSAFLSDLVLEHVKRQTDLGFLFRLFQSLYTQTFVLPTSFRETGIRCLVV